MHWSGHYRVWSLDEFTQQNLVYNTERPIHRLLKPHTNREIFMETPLSFPFKDSYEKTNTTLEGLRDKDIRDGDPEIPRPGLEYKLGTPYPGQIDDGTDFEDGGDDDGGDSHGGGRKVSKSDSVMKPVDPLHEESYEYDKEGKAGDGKIYLNDIGELTKLEDPTKLGKMVEECSEIHQDLLTNTPLMNGNEPQLPIAR